MTAPIASLFAAPPDAGAQSVAPAAGPAANSGDSFAGHLSALFEAAEGSPTAAPSLPQASDTETPAAIVKKDLTVGDLVQPGFMLSAAEALADRSQSMSPPSEPQTTHVAELTQALLADAANLEQTAFGNGGPPNALALLQDTSTALPTPANNIPQNEKAGAASESDVQISPGATAQTTQILEAEPKASASSNGVAVANPEPHAGNPAQSGAPIGSSANSPSTAKQEESARTDDQRDQSLIDILSLSEIAPPVVAQLLAAQPQPDPRQGQVKFDQLAVSTHESAAIPIDDASDALAHAKNGLTAAFSVITQTTDIVQAKSAAPASVPPPDTANAPNTSASDAAAELTSPGSAPVQSNAGNPIFAAAEPQSGAPKSAENTKPGHAPANLGETAGPATSHGKISTATNQSETAQEANGVSSNPADRLSAATADADAIAKDDSASRPTVSKTGGAARSTADIAETASADDHADTPNGTSASAASNAAVEAAVSNVAVRPVAASERDAVDSAASIETVSPDLSGRPGVTSRATRAPVRGSFAINRDAVDSQSQSPISSGPNLVSAPEKSDPIRAAELTQDRDGSKSVSQPNPTNVAESTPAADASKAHQPADLAQAAEPTQPPAERIDTSATPAAPLPQPASSDIVLPAGSSTHSFEMPLLHTAAPSAQDAPVRLAFNAPNVLDNSAFDALALKIASHSSDGDSHFSIRLDPPELGKIEVNLSVDAHGHAQAELSADKVQTLELLQKDASSLERALKDAGLNLSGGLAFSLKGDGRSQAWRDSQNGRSRSLQIAAADAASASATMTARAALAAQAYGLPISNLDIRV